MAQQDINVGTNANDGTGDALRSAFQKCQNNFDDLYGDELNGEVNSITATAPLSTTSAVGTPTLSLLDAGVTFAKMQDVAANSLLIRNANSSGVLSELALATTQIMIGDGTGMIGAALSGDVTMTNAGVVSIGSDKVTYDKMQDTATANRLLGAVTAGTIGEVQVVAAMMGANSVDSDSYVDGSIDTIHIADSQVTVGKMAADSVDSDQYVNGSIDTVHVADDNITFAKLEPRYTAKIDITTYTGAVSIDWATGTTFCMGSAITGNIEFDFTNYKQGQVITLYYLTGAYTITFDSDAGTSETFNKVGGVDYVGGSSNTIIVECVKDGADAVFNYSCAAYVSDATPS